ncbi:MAG: type II toxin-antitoxin system RelE/ParE family toxin [Actinomycetota bacterium]|jgi:mRNA interferase RelE/StbE|nr:type II toxin-antitoxin system RelE/ParE family toxin [Actinomycetota bacterium]
MIEDATEFEQDCLFLKSKKQLLEPDKAIQERAVSALERIRMRPEAYIAMLIGDPGCKIKIGHYRVIIDIDKQNLLILIIKIDHRKNIYEK